MSVPNRRRLPVTKMFSRVALVDYVGGNQRTSIVRGEVCENAGRYQAQVARASVRSPLQRLCGSVVCRKETLESKLRESHVDWRAENRRGTYEAELAGVGYKLERDEHTRGLVAGRRHPWLQHVRGWVFRELREQVDEYCISRLFDLGAKAHQQMRTPLGEICDTRRESGWMQAEP